jgi:hypothetical protein
MERSPAKRKHHWNTQEMPWVFFSLAHLKWQFFSSCANPLQEYLQINHVEQPDSFHRRSKKQDGQISFKKVITGESQLPFFAFTSWYCWKLLHQILQNDRPSLFLKFTYWIEKWLDMIGGLFSWWLNWLHHSITLREQRNWVSWQAASTNREHDQCKYPVQFRGTSWKREPTAKYRTSRPAHQRETSLHNWAHCKPTSMNAGWT